MRQSSIGNPFTCNRQQNLKRPRTIQKRISKRGHEESDALQRGSSPIWSHNRNIQRFPQKPKKTAKQAFGKEADRCIRMFLFRKQPVQIQRKLWLTKRRVPRGNRNVPHEEVPRPADENNMKNLQTPTN